MPNGGDKTRTEVAHGVPEDWVEFTKEQFLNAGAVSVEAEKESPGGDTYTVTATFVPQADQPD